MLYYYFKYQFTQIVCWGVDECLSLTHPMPYYHTPQDKIDGKLSNAEISLWKAPWEVYQVLLYWCNLHFDDYPAWIGPICGEMHMVSYLDSVVTLSPIYFT